MKRVLIAMVIAAVFVSASGVDAGPLSRLRARRAIGGNREISRVVQRYQPVHRAAYSKENSATFRNRTRASFAKNTHLVTEDTHVCRLYGPMEVEPGLYYYYAVTCPSGTAVAYYSQRPDLPVGGSCGTLEDPACEEIGGGSRTALNKAAVRLLQQQQR